MLCRLPRTAILVSILTCVPQQVVDLLDVLIQEVLAVPLLLRLVLLLYLDVLSCVFAI